MKIFSFHAFAFSRGTTKKGFRGHFYINHFCFVLAIFDIVVHDVEAIFSLP